MTNYVYVEFSDMALKEALRPLIRDYVEIDVVHDDIYQVVVKGMTDQGMLTWSHNPDVIGGDVELFAADIAERITNEFKRV